MASQRSGFKSHSGLNIPGLSPYYISSVKKQLQGSHNHHSMKSTSKKNCGISGLVCIKCRLQITDWVQNADKVQNADCRLGSTCRMKPKLSHHNYDMQYIYHIDHFHKWRHKLLSLCSYVN